MEGKTPSGFLYMMRMHGGSWIMIVMVHVDNQMLHLE